MMMPHCMTKRMAVSMGLLMALFLPPVYWASTLSRMSSRRASSLATSMS